MIDVGGLRLLTDPTFDPPGEHGYLTKLTGPALAPEDLGPVDAVLLSHDLHPDNLDDAGRAYALAAPRILCGPRARARLGGPAVGVAPWETITLSGRVTARALPAQHGPDDGARDEDGNVNCEVTGFVLSGDGVPTVYVSGDNASIGVVAEIVDRVGPVDVAVLFVGAARVPPKERGRPLTFTAERAAAAAALLGADRVVPVHCEGWAHFSEDTARVEEAFDDAGLAGLLHLAAPGDWALST